MLFRRFLFQLAHLLLDALQHRVRTYRSLDYAFRRLSDAFLNFGFLGSHIFWYLSLRKIFRRKQKFCWVQMYSICCSCSWRPRRLNRKIWRPSQGSLQPCFGLSVRMSAVSLKTLRTFINCIFIWYGNRKIALLPFRVYRGYTRIHDGKPSHDWRPFCSVFRDLQG